MLFGFVVGSTCRNKSHGHPPVGAMRNLIKDPVCRMKS